MTPSPAPTSKTEPVDDGRLKRAGPGPLVTAHTAGTAKSPEPDPARPR